MPSATNARPGSHINVVAWPRVSDATPSIIVLIYLASGGADTLVTPGVERKDYDND